MALRKKAGRSRGTVKVPDGFLSVAALHRLRRVAIVAGATSLISFFLVYVSIFVMAFLLPNLGKKGNAYATVLRSDGVLYIGGAAGGRASLLSLRQRETQAKEKTLATFTDKLDDVFLLDDPARQRLWILSDTQQGFWDGKTAQWLGAEKTWEKMSRPFLWDGSPAFLSQDGGQVSLWKLEKNAWRRHGAYTLVGVAESACNCNSVRVARWENAWHWFYLDGDKLRGFQGLPQGSHADVRLWKPLGGDTARLNWAPKALAGGLYLVDHGLDATVRVRELEKGRWVFVPGNWGKGENVALLDGPDAKPMLALAVPGLRIVPFQNGAPALTVINPSFQGLKTLRVLMPMLFIVLILVLGTQAMLVLLDRESRMARPARVRFAGKNRRLAGLLRRGVARLTDTFLVLLCALPVAALCSWALNLFKDLSGDPAKLLFIMMIFVFWIMAGQFVVIAVEGTYGTSPGRKLAGIRLLGVDLKPCGIPRSLLRGLLTMVDGQFFWVPGVLTAALSRHQQRLGDLAADTVVVFEIDRPWGVRK